MSRHSFDPEVARLVGCQAAVLFQNIAYWCERNAVKGRNVHDGNAWTFNSVKQLAELFGYLSAKQIRNGLDKLEETGLVVTANYNTDPRDRTKWYAISPDADCFAYLVHKHLPKKAERSAQKGEPLPDIKPNIKQTPIPPEGADDLFSEFENSDLPNDPTQSSEVDEIQEGFQQFWEEIWPNHKRKVGKSDCQKTYTAACLGKHSKAEKITPQQLNRCASAYIASVNDQQFLKGPLPWLRLPGWEPFMADAQEFNIEDLNARQRAMLEDGRVPPSMMEDGQPNAAAQFWLKKFGFGRAA